MVYERLELKTTKGKRFLGPFVFKGGEGVVKRRKLDWLTRTKPKEEGEGELRLVSVEKGSFPAEALWRESFDAEAAEVHRRRVMVLERKWGAFGESSEEWEEEEEEEGEVGE